jgi:hypothetical protein
MLAGDLGAVSLARVLETSCALSELHLHNNLITAEGSRALARAVRGNRTLVLLKYVWCGEGVRVGCGVWVWVSVRW